MKVKAIVEKSIITKTIQRVVDPAFPEVSRTGGSGFTVGMGAIEVGVCVGTNSVEVLIACSAMVIKASIGSRMLIMSFLNI
jgi:hypothetical protein